MNGQDHLPPISRTSFAVSVFGGRLSGRRACTAIQAIIHADRQLESMMQKAGFRYNVNRPYSGREHRILSEHLSARHYLIEYYLVKNLYEQKKKL